jgi:hypothetical protein
MSDANFDLARAHTWFAVECNNQAWELVEKSSRTAEETQQMLHQAHAAAWHWAAVGTNLNRQRAECLLASAYVAAGDAAAAVRHGERCLSLSVENAGEETPFDRATSLACAAAAHALAGNHAQAERLRTLAAPAAEKLPDVDREVFDKLYP